MVAEYDGYKIKGVGSVYNPNSVMRAIHTHHFQSYWPATSDPTSLLEYLYGALTPSNMRWVGEHLIHYADCEENQKPYTMEEIHAMIEASQADIAAGKTYSHDDVMREWDEEMALLEQAELKYAEAV